jgi:tRNA nucleotidyltransferase/poly(A) polymerase
MADFIYLLQTRLTAAQRAALAHVQTAAKSRNITIFLVGGAVRDLTTGSPIRDLDVVVQGNALKLKKDLEKAGGTVIGEHEAVQALYVNFPGGVRLEVGSTLSVTFPKPGKPVYTSANILDDLRRRDFTANAMAISLNEGSYGLVMDPLNGMGDLENRELRLVSNYGFIEDPSRMIRAVRFSARLGWQMEEKTRQRYETGKSEGYISALNPTQRAYELEEVFHEEDPLRVQRRLESEGWAKVLSPVWTAAKANENELNRMRDLVAQFNEMGIYPDASPAYFPLLTAKLQSKDVATLKKSFARPGFAAQVAALESETKAFAMQFTSKAAAAPSDAWRLLYSAEPEPVLALAFASKTGPVAAKFKAFFTEWSQSRLKIPYQTMQEMRIVPELPVYQELLDKLFFAIMDGKLDTPEATKAFLEPFSPPAPPPVVNMRRRVVKREAKAPKPRTKKVAAAPVATEEGAAVVAAKVAAPKAAAVPAKPAAPAKSAAPAKAVAKAPAKPAVKAATKPAAKVVAKKTVVKAVAKKVAKPVAKKPIAQKVVAKKAPAKKAIVKKAVKPVAKKVTKPVAKKTVSKPKPVAKKVVAKKAAPKKPVAKKAVKGRR